MSDSIGHTKKAILEALKASLGIVSTACKTVGISRNTYYRWLKEDAEFADEVANISEDAIDFVESKLFEKINGISVQKETMAGPEIYELPPSDTAIIFYLKTKGKKRGYIEKQEVEHSGNGLNLNIIMPEGE